jgi:hypothetical protein
VWRSFIGQERVRGERGGKGGSVAGGEWPSFNVFASGGGETMRPGRW